MSYFMVDIESDGPIPEKWIPEALAISGMSRQDCLEFPDPAQEMARFGSWVAEHSKGKPLFISDNNGFDWQFTNWYFHHFLGANPFGFSSTNLGSLYKGLVKDVTKNFKHLRRTAHTHNPLDDVLGNAEALLSMQGELGLKVELR